MSGIGIYLNALPVGRVARIYRPATFGQPLSQRITLLLDGKARIRKSQPGWNVFRDGCPRGGSAEEVCARADRLIVQLRTCNGDVDLFSHGPFQQRSRGTMDRAANVAGQHFSFRAGIAQHSGS